MTKTGWKHPRHLLAWLLIFSLAFAEVPAQASLAQFQPSYSAVSPGRPERAASPEGALALEKTYPLTGRVTDGSGNGLAGVTITAVPYSHRLFMPLVQSPTGSSAVTSSTAVRREGSTAPYVTTTDASGAYTFPSLPVGSYLLRAEKVGFEFSPGSRIVALPAPDEQDFQILLLPADLSPTTRVISPETNAKLASISPDGAKFTFAQATPELQGLAPGDIMAGAATKAAPNGYLRKVTKVSTQGGQVIVETEPAVLEEALEDGSLYIRSTLDPTDVLSTQALQGVELRQADTPATFLVEITDAPLYDADENPGTTDDQVRASGFIEFELDYEFYLNIQEGTLHNLTFIEHSVLRDELEIRSGIALADLQSETVLSSLDFAPVTAWIGELPVVVVPQLEVVVGADGSVAVGMTSNVAHDLTLRAGAAYTPPDGWQALGEHSHHFTFTPPHPTLEASLRGYYSPRMNLTLYGLAGPYVQPTTYQEFEVTPEADPWWSLEGGAEALAGYQTAGERAGLRLEAHAVQAVEVQEILATAQKGNQAPNAPSNPAPAHEVTGQSLDITLSWDGGDPDEGLVTYDVYLEAEDSSPDELVSRDQVEQSYSPGELEVGVTYYWQIIAKDEHGWRTDGPVWSFTTKEITASPLAAGSTHTCALTETGGVRCWGNNEKGQLGNGENINRYTPVDVVGLSSGIVALAAGMRHTCALTEAGGVKCWGSNQSGQLGDGTTNDSSTPVDVPALSRGVVALAAGNSYTCALTGSGIVKCWGSNTFGQLGNGTTDQSNIPVEVTGLSSKVVALVAGGGQTCALSEAGGVQCWGDNSFGKLGNGTPYDALTPVAVTGLSSGVKALAAGDNHTCAVTDTGGVRCWGYNYYGQFGDGTRSNSWIPSDEIVLSGPVQALTAGFIHTCALMEDGAVQCWGSNGSGRLGNGTTTDSPTPVAVTGLTSGVKALVAGDNYTCAMTAKGGVKCWGDNHYGQLGEGTTPWKSIPVKVVGLSDPGEFLAAGENHTCISISGSVKCWGYNWVGQLGDGTTIDRDTPVDVIGLTGLAGEPTAGESHTCTVMDGEVYCWGGNWYGQLGDGTTSHSSIPVKVTGLVSPILAVAVGGEHTCALTEAGGVKCWGENGFGQLGNGTNTDSSTPVDVTGLTSGVKALAAGPSHTCALLNDGGVKCWGANWNGQLGNGTTFPSNIPVVVNELSEVAALAAGGSHTCALLNDGGVKCWGANWYGQLGNGTTTQSNIPVEVIELSGVTILTAAGNHTCATIPSEGIKCWGWNEYGQLGDGTKVNSNTPVEVLGLEGEVIDLAAGEFHTCALMSSGVFCWGSNDQGQLGDGAGPWKTTPTDVIGFEGEG